MSLLFNLAAIAVGLFMISTAAIYTTPSIAAEAESLDLNKLGRIDELVKKAIRDGMLLRSQTSRGTHGLQLPGRRPDLSP